MLSNKDIKRELITAKNLAIYPLKYKNINGSSINLTASKYAWNSEGNSIVDDNHKVITIEPGEIAHIMTEEALWVSTEISGTYHSRVSLSARGLSNISTTLDPEWTGLSYISLTNTSKKPQTINVGDGIVTLTLSYLNTPSERNNDKAASRKDLYGPYLEKHPEAKTYLMDNPDHIRENLIRLNMKKSAEYKELKDEKLNIKTWNFLQKPLIVGVIGPVLSSILTVLLTYHFLK